MKTHGRYNNCINKKYIFLIRNNSTKNQSSETHMNDGTRIKALENGLKILMAIPSGKGISITALSHQVDMTKSAICKILSTFRDYGFVSQDGVTKEYTLGPTLIAKGFQALNQLDIRALAKPELRRLTERYNENSMLMIEQNEQVVIIELCEADVPIKLTMRLGQCHPFYRGAAPKVLLAFQPEERIQSVVARIVFEPPLTDNTIHDKDVLLQRLAQIRRDGYCISEGEIDVLTLAVAVPILDAQSKIVASMAVSGPKSRVDRQNMRAMIEDLKDSARRVSQRLGA